VGSPLKKVELAVFLLDRHMLFVGKFLTARQVRKD